MREVRDGKRLALHLAGFEDVEVGAGLRPVRSSSPTSGISLAGEFLGWRRFSVLARVCRDLALKRSDGGGRIRTCEG
jgi:hypothetical protein